MDHQTLQLFGRQLARWAEEFIAEGRFPFRRIETSLPLLTDQGEISLPLVLWVNRDSFMAGGLFLFPTRTTEEELESGLAFADALGLRHFVTWARREIIIWEAAGGEPRACRRIPLPAVSRPDPDQFREALRTVLEEIKLLAITGALPPNQLSPWYLANLCRLTCKGTLPSLSEAFRIARGAEKPLDEPSPAGLARQQANLVILRLFALLLEDRLPTSIAPEGLGRALQFAIETLPSPLARVLEPASWEIPLPEESAIRLHHLFRRLGQLRLPENRQRARLALEIVLGHEGRQLGGYPLPSETVPKAALVVNADGFCRSAGSEVASAPLLGFSALLRHLNGDPPATQAADVFCLNGLPRPSSILGTLAAGAPPAPSERRTLAAHLRRSWPNRRFPTLPSTPRWFWDLLHLLGVAEEEAQLDLVTPGEWLTALWADPLIDLLREQFTLLCLERRGEGVRVRLAKQRLTDAGTSFHGLGGERELPWDQLREGERSLLPLYLDLPDPLFCLLTKGRLRLGEEELWSPEQAAGILLFSRSSAGRLLWRTVTGGKPLPTPPDLKLLRRFGLPLPPLEVLRHLQMLPPDQQLPVAAIDRELEPWLGKLSLQPPSDSAAGTERRPAVRLTDALAEEVSRVVFVDGIPRFPEHYLYDHYRPQLTGYTFTPPLSADGEFFGQMTLVDQAGVPLTVEGEETARALLLASYSTGSPVLLPTDRQLTTVLLERYLADLQRLHQSLVREAHRRLTNPRAASHLIERIWGSLPLPPWPLVAEENSSPFPGRGL